MWTIHVSLLLFFGRISLDWQWALVGMVVLINLILHIHFFHRLAVGLYQSGHAQVLRPEQRRDEGPFLYYCRRRLRIMGKSLNSGFRLLFDWSWLRIKFLLLSYGRLLHFVRLDLALHVHLFHRLAIGLYQGGHA